jgi:SOS-response transcriptional repressor LexA
LTRFLVWKILDMSFYERLKAYMEGLKPPLTYYRLNQLVDIPSSHFSQWKKGDRSPSPLDLEKLSRVQDLGLSIETLKGWRALDQFGEKAIFEALKDIKGASLTNAQVKINESDEKTAYLEKVFEPVKGQVVPLPINEDCKIPIKGTVSAGVLTWAEEHDLGYIIWPPDRPIPNGAFALKVKGDSMEPAVPDGSVVAVKPVERFKHGKKYVIMNHDGDTTLKVVQVSRDGLTLVPLNPYYQPITMRSVDLAKAWEVLSTTVFE